MKIRFTKKLAALTLAGAMLSLTGCGAEQENNEVAITKEYNEVDIFKNIGIEDYIVEGEDFKNLITEMEENNYKFYKTEMGENVVSIVNENNKLCGVVAHNIKNMVTISYIVNNILNYDYCERQCVYEYDQFGSQIGDMITDNYFDTLNGTIYSSTTSNGNLYMQAVMLTNEKNQTLGISIGEPENNERLIIINENELKVKQKDFNKLKEKMYKCGFENDFTNFLPEVLKVLDKYKVNKIDNIAYQKTIKA